MILNDYNKNKNYLHQNGTQKWFLQLKLSDVQFVVVGIVGEIGCDGSVGLITEEQFASSDPSLQSFSPSHFQVLYNNNNINMSNTNKYIYIYTKIKLPFEGKLKNN